MKSNKVPALLGEKIKHARKKSKMRQKDLAEKLGCSTGAVCQWERSLTTPDIGYVVATAQETKMPVSWFFDDSLPLNYQTEKREPRLNELTIRDFFAAKAMQALVEDSFYDTTAKMSYAMADEMMKARQQ